MNESMKALDNLSRKERALNRRSILIGIVFVAAILLAGFLSSIGETIQVQGTTKGLYGKPDDLGERMFLIVTLDNGNDVKVSLPNKTPFIKDSRIIATQTTTRLFGIKRYSFLQYVPTEDRPTSH
jgi:hypothetical protein